MCSGGGVGGYSVCSGGDSLCKGAVVIVVGVL